MNLSHLDPQLSVGPDVVLQTSLSFSQDPQLLAETLHQLLLLEKNTEDRGLKVCQRHIGITASVAVPPPPRYLVRQLVVLVALPVVGEVLHLRQELSLRRRRAVVRRTAGARAGPPEGGGARDQSLLYLRRRETQTHSVIKYILPQFYIFNDHHLLLY